MIKLPESFDGRAYVGFSDLCGYKQMAKKNRKTAITALDYLFDCIADIQNDSGRLLRTGVHAIGVSDCVIYWSPSGDLKSVVDVAAWFHRKMIEKRYLLRTTIACGDLFYRQRCQQGNLQLANLGGGAYDIAFDANDKIDAGMIVFVDSGDAVSPKGDRWRRCSKPKGWELFWSVRLAEDIPKVKKDRKRAVNLKWDMLKDVYGKG